MKHNRSLKDIFIPKSYQTGKESPDSIWSPRNLQPEHF